MGECGGQVSEELQRDGLGESRAVVEIRHQLAKTAVRIADGIDVPTQSTKCIGCIGTISIGTVSMKSDSNNDYDKDNDNNNDNDNKK